MREPWDALHNEGGKTAVILIIIIVAGIAYWLYPGTSYYNAKAEANLKELHSACKRHWAEGIAQRMVTKATGIKKEVTSCELKTIMKTPISFQPLEGMTFEIVNGTKTDFQATGKHAEGDQLIRINAEGKISS